jgi:integrase
MDYEAEIRKLAGETIAWSGQAKGQARDLLAGDQLKTERSRRTIALPDTLIQALRTHRKAQAEHCLKLGCGRFDLVFPTWDGKLMHPAHFTKAFAREVSAAKLPSVTFHGLRHTHITHLLRSGVPVHVVSERAGHANPTVTLNMYAHLLPGQQEAAAAIIDAALRTALKE